MKTSGFYFRRSVARSHGLLARCWLLLTLMLALLSASCRKSGGSGGSSFGLTQRVAVEGLGFPTGLPTPGPMRAVRRFPRLSFRQPVFVTAAPDGTSRLFVVEKEGRIRVFPDADDDVATAAVFLDITDRVHSDGEMGLLGLAFPPDYASVGTFHVYYSLSNPLRSRVSRFAVTADPDAADPQSESILLEFSQPFTNHKAGMLAFGPDGMLYVATGDGGSGNDPQDNAQNLGSLLGKILRLTPEGQVPGDNPFAGVSGARGEIWAYGLRNPWRFSFDRQTGALWAGDVGQNAVEEIDIVLKGGNYGWRVYEGNRSNINPGGLPASAFEAPVHTYSHALGSSVTGGYVYRGARLPSLAGAYVYGDFVAGTLWALVYDGSQVVSNTALTTVSSPSSFGEDRDGELLVVSLDGALHGLEEETVAPEPFPESLSATGLFTDVAGLVAAPGVIEYDVNAPFWSDGARKRRWLALPGLAEITFAAEGAWSFPVGTAIVKHFELDLAPGSTRRLETRVLLRHASGWQGYVYRWNDAQTDADLIPDAETAVFTVADPAAPGGTRQQTWQFPSRTQCRSCHTDASGVILGVRTRQLNRDFVYGEMADNQLRSWSHIGLFAADIGSHLQYEAHPDPADPGVPIEDRARVYLEVNCAQCHLPGGPAPGSLDFRLEASLTQMGLSAAPQNGDLGLMSPLVISPGRKESSILWERLRRVDAARMPPLGAKVADGDGVELIGAWIDAGPR